MRRLTLIALALSIFLPRCTSSSNSPARPAAVAKSSHSALDVAVPLDPDVRHGVLPNGLTYYIRANHKPEKRAELRLAVNAGSVLETDEQRGLAHFVEHMAFNGTTKYPKQALVDYLERIGMRFGPDVNAYTSFDETVYMLQIPTDDPKVVDTAFDILHEWAGSLTFQPDRIQKERGVITEEWRLGRGAGARIRDKQLPVVFHASRYAERLPIGLKEIIQNASPEQIRKFYSEWYRPDLMAVVAVGDFDPAAIEHLVRERFGSLPAKKHAPQRKTFPIPDHKETLTSVATDREATGTTVEVDFKRPPVRHETVANYREELVDGLYHTMMNQRLAELGREADPPYQGAFAASGPLGRTKSAYRLFARVNDGGVERALTTLLTEAKRVDQYGFAETELSRAKTLFLRNADRAYEERNKEESEGFASEYVANYLDREPAPGIAYERDLYHQLLPAITLAEVNARANQWITEEDRVILVSGPDKKEARIPDEKPLLAVFNATDRLAVTPWVDRVREEPLVARTPAAGKVIEEKSFADVGVTRWKLSNGTTVLLKPTDFKNDEVLIRGWHTGGLSLAPDAAHVTTEVAANLVARMGLGAFDVTELGKALTGKVASVSPYMTELGEGVQGGASPRDLETAFQLLYLRFTAPRRDEKAFASFLTNMRGQLANQEASPGYWFSRRMNEVLTSDSPRRRLLSLEDLKSVDVDQALSFYRDRFADASGFIFTIVGNFDPAAIRPQVETWIGGLPSTARNETWRRIDIEPLPGVQKVNVEKGIEPRSSVRIVFHGPAKWSLGEAHHVAALADLLRIRLREDLREDRGGVYGVGVNGGISRYPVEKYTFNITFAADPKRVDELVAATFDDLRKLKMEGPSEDFVSRVREQEKREREVSLKENRFWASQLEYLTWNDLDYSEIAKGEQRINGVTRDSVQSAAQKYLDDKQYVIGVLNPETTPAAAAASH
jgi:zinc protease